MVARKAINSLSLRQDFPDLYQDLFSSCQIAVSSADSFFWAGEYARFFGGLTILQKLPTKNIVGLEILNEKKICFADKLHGYNPQRNQFEHIPFDVAKEKRLISFLEKFWPILDPDGKVPGFRIHLLSESHCGGGLGTTGVILACLAACLHLLSEKITPKDLDSWSITPTQDLISQEKHQNFRDLFHLSWQLTAICRDGNSSGATSFAALINSPYPVVYFSESVNSYLPTACVPGDDSVDRCQFVNNLAYWGGTLDEIFSIRLPQPWPIDIGRIYSGNLINTENIFKVLSNMQSSLDWLQKNLNKELVPKIQKQNITISSLFNQNISQTFSYSDYIDIFNINTLKLLFSLKDLFELGPNEETLRHFTNTMHQLQDFNHFLGHSTPTLDQICDRMTQVAAAGNEYGLSAAKVEGIGKGGHSIFIGPAGTMPPYIIPSIEQLSKDLSRDIYLDWASWIDGFGEAGLQVEQFTFHKIYSTFISTQSNIITTFTNDIKETKIIDQHETENILQNYDLFFSLPNNKIYIKGQILSSKEIPSAKATIDIIRKIIDSKNSKITNRAFQDTSYGQSRYDLQSKIFIPLNKTLQKIAGKTLEFSISGGMYDDYSVSVNIKNLSLGMLDKIEH